MAVDRPLADPSRRTDIIDGRPVIPLFRKHPPCGFKYAVGRHRPPPTCRFHPRLPLSQTYFGLTSQSEITVRHFTPAVNTRFRRRLMIPGIETRRNGVGETGVGNGGQTYVYEFIFHTI